MKQGQRGRTWSDEESGWPSSQVLSEWGSTELSHLVLTSVERSPREDVCVDVACKHVTCVVLHCGCLSHRFSRSGGHSGTVANTTGSSGTINW